MKEEKYERTRYSTSTTLLTAPIGSMGIVISPGINNKRSSKRYTHCYHCATTSHMLNVSFQFARDDLFDGVD